MCGIYGMVSLTGRPLRWRECMAGLGRDLRHRGPDAHRVQVTPVAAFGVERLRIVDPRPAADQPFTTPTTTLVCNGEVYNDHELRRSAGPHAFHSRSDVEPLLPLLDREGPTALRRVDGMFALAHWAAETSSLTLARDPAGEKPLFYLIHEGELWFASEIRALLRHPGPRPGPDPEGLEAYLALGYTPEPLTVFRGIRKVPAGRALVFTGTDAPIAIDCVRDAAPGVAGIGELERVLRRSVARRCRADVPVGVFLSGGLDSTLITAFAREATLGGPLHTFSARFVDSAFDESRAAREVAETFHTVHHEVVIDEGALGSALGRVVAHSAEPLADPALLPTVALAEAAARRVGVVLGGEGADELFGGYPTYQGHLWAQHLPAGFEPWVRRLRRVLATAAASHNRVPPGWLLDRFLTHALEPWGPRHLAWQGWGVMPLLSGSSRARLAERWVPGPHPPVGASVAVRAMDLDWRTALRDSLLVKVDRATMMFGLEARAPFVGPEVAEAARRLPATLRVTPCRGKIALRRVAAPFVPAGVLNRRKRGLSVPIGRWLNGTLRPEVDRLWNSPGMETVVGVFPGVPIPQLLTEHRAGSHNHARPIWTVLTLLYWLEHWGPS